MDRYSDAKYRKAYEVIDKLLEIETSLNEPMGTISDAERSEIARSAFNHFWSLGQIFKSTTNELVDLAIPEGTSPVANSDYDDEEYDGISTEEWRDVLASLLYYSVPIPTPISNNLANALLALNQGEIQELLKPRATGKRTRAWSLSRLQLAAYVHVYRLAGEGYRIGEARDIVARAYGFHENGGNTIRSWTNRELKEAFGKSYLDRMKSMALEAGEIIKNDSMFAEDTDVYIGHFASMLKMWDIECCAELYMQALRGDEVHLPYWLKMT